MGHWYDKDGNPRHITNGRSTTLRDARKHNLVPSVSNVWGDMVNKPMLHRWKENGMMEAMYNGGGCINCDEENLFEDRGKSARGVFYAMQQDTQDRGTTIHDALEKKFKGEEIPAGFLEICNNVEEALDKRCGKQIWVTEKTFAHREGYGGMVDLHSESFCVDFKTKALEPDKEVNIKKMIYPDHGVQLAAYDHGLGNGGRILINLFIDINSRRVYEWEHEDPEYNLECFLAALKLWKLLKKYDPKWYIM